MTKNDVRDDYDDDSIQRDRHLGTGGKGSKVNTGPDTLFVSVLLIRHDFGRRMFFRIACLFLSII
jgi:hypothetical protein